MNPSAKADIVFSQPRIHSPGLGAAGYLLSGADAAHFNDAGRGFRVIPSA
jgi:hypothetical protein